MDKTYHPEQIETHWYQQWESNGAFSPSGEGSPYAIMLPPPNVTGTLHMGHGFNNTIMDTLIRYQRMLGKNTLWQPGTDHAGIATQMVVERQLNADGKTRHDLGRSDFINRVWQWKHTSGDAITQQLRRLGSSLDWQRDKFTMDEDLSQSVQHVFIKLYQEGLIYRGKRLVNWDPVLHTAVSDLEVISEEESGHLWHFSYPLTDESGDLTIATTRPETLLGDAAVAVNPNDSRYQHLIGKTVTLPIVGRIIPIIADDYVDPEFGTGCVKITPAHDFNDAEIGQRHQLEALNILRADATLNDDVPVAYQGLDRFVARKKIIEEMSALNKLVKIEDHRLMVPRGDRSGAIIEPFLTDQWYVKADKLAKPAIDAVKNQRVKFIPKNWENTFYRWMEDIHDWCISRQIWWGHRIPAWYDPNGNIYVGANEASIRSEYQLADDLVLKQDEDVLDTWFSSALWPFSTLGWPEKNTALSTWYPGSVLVTGFDIIFFWVARMMMMGLHFMDEVPFKEVYIHGLVRDSHGQKMSKSKGNVIDPIDIIDGISLEDLIRKRTTGMMQPAMANKIEQATRKTFPNGITAHGTDALRFTFASLASTGRDINFDMNRITGYRNFCNKLWNAARYVLLNTNDTRDHNLANNQALLSLADKWINTKQQLAIKAVRQALDQYRFDIAAQTIYEFIWHHYCDWYLELVKPILTSDEYAAEEKHTTVTNLITVLESALRLTHPIMPFITEEIWQNIAPLIGNNDNSIMQQPYPTADEAQIDHAATAEMEWVMAFVSGVRSIRSQMNITPKKTLPVLLKQINESDKSRLENNQQFLQSLANIASIEIINDKGPAAATALVGSMEILIPLEGLIDKAEEVKRLDKEINKLEKLYQQASKKLANPRYIDNAPEAVVNKEREKQHQLHQAIIQLTTKRDTLIK